MGVTASGEAGGVTVPGEPVIIDGENPDNWCTIDNIVSGKFMLGVGNKVTFIESLDCPFTAPEGYVFASDWERTARNLPRRLQSPRGTGRAKRSRGLAAPGYGRAKGSRGRPQSPLVGPQAETPAKTK